MIIKTQPCILKKTLLICKKGLILHTLMMLSSKRLSIYIPILNLMSEHKHKFK